MLDPDRWQVLEDSVRGDVTMPAEMVTTFVEDALARVEELRPKSR